MSSPAAAGYELKNLEDTHAGVDKAAIQTCERRVALEALLGLFFSSRVSCGC